DQRAGDRRAAGTVRRVRPRRGSWIIQETMAAPLLKVQGVSKHFGGFTALSEVSIAIAPGERFGLIGPSGSIEFQGEEISGLPAYRRTRKGIARSFQIPRPFRSMSVLENLLVPYEYVV